MTPYDLVIGDRAYSSWSLRGWLLFDAFGLPVRSHLARLYSDELPDLLARGYFPGRTAPTMRTPEGTVVPETIAIAEELASRHPAAGIWPADPHARATARVLAAEMHAGFAALRSHCPMNLRVSYDGCDPPRRGGRRSCPAGNPVGLGAAGDGQRRPVAVRRLLRRPMPSLPRWQAGSPATTCRRVGRRHMAYVAAHLAHPSFRRWRAMALVDGAGSAILPPRPSPQGLARPRTAASRCRRREAWQRTPPAPIPASPSPSMVARTYTVAFEGVEARMVEVQCAVTPECPAFRQVVGLPDKAVSEARERVRAALTGAGHRAADRSGSRSTCRPPTCPRKARISTCPSRWRCWPRWRSCPKDEVEAYGRAGRTVARRHAGAGAGRTCPPPWPRPRKSVLLCPRACGAEAAWVGASRGHRRRPRWPR
jgi:glutathione S-transferase